MAFFKRFSSFLASVKISFSTFLTSLGDIDRATDGCLATDIVMVVVSGDWVYQSAPLDELGYNLWRRRKWRRTYDIIAMGIDNDEI